MNRPPEQNLREESLADEAELHEELLRIFGELVMWCRSDALQGTRNLVENAEARASLATAFRGIFDQTADQLDAAQREIAAELCSRAVGQFGRNLMTLLSGTGMSLPVSSKLAARLRLVMELCDRETGDVVDERVINRGGKKFFADYWNKWLAQSRPPPDLPPSTSRG